MTGSAKQMLNKAALIVEFMIFSAFVFSTCLLYYALTHQAPIPPEQQLDNDFVPYFLLILLSGGACVFGLTFLIHFTVWRIIKMKEKRETAKLSA